MLLVSSELNYPCSRQRDHSFGMNALFSGTCSCSDLSQRGIRCDPLATERLGLFTWEHVWYSSLVPIRNILDLHLVQKNVYHFISAQFNFFCSFPGSQKMCSRFLCANMCQRRSSIGIVIWYKDEKCMPCKYITNMHAQEYAQEPLKCMVVSMSFHGDAWSIDASVREVLQCHGCHQLPCMEFMIGSCMITKMSCDAMMDCVVASTWYEAKQSCQKKC